MRLRGQSLRARNLCMLTDVSNRNGDITETTVSYHSELKWFVSVVCLVPFQIKGLLNALAEVQPRFSVCVGDGGQLALVDS